MKHTSAIASGTARVHASVRQTVVTSRKNNRVVMLVLFLCDICVCVNLKGQYSNVSRSSSHSRIAMAARQRGELSEDNVSHIMKQAQSEAKNTYDPEQHLPGMIFEF